MFVTALHIHRRSLALYAYRSLRNSEETCAHRTLLDPHKTCQHYNFTAINQSFKSMLELYVGILYTIEEFQRKERSHPRRPHPFTYIYITSPGYSMFSHAYLTPCGLEPRLGETAGGHPWSAGPRSVAAAARGESCGVSSSTRTHAGKKAKGCARCAPHSCCLPPPPIT